jgi:hypothetical protein
MRMDERTDMTKLIVAFHNFAKSYKSCYVFWRVAILRQYVRLGSTMLINKNIQNIENVKHGSQRRVHYGCHSSHEFSVYFTCCHVV